MDITEHKKADEESETHRMHLEELVKERTAELTKVNEKLQKEIEKLKHTETGIKSSEERLKILFEYAPDAYYLSDLKGYFIDGNKAAEHLIGYKRDELIGKSFLKLKLLPPKQITKAAKLLAKNAIGKPTGPDEFNIIRKDGNQVPVEIRTFPIKIDNKSLVLGIARDITERVQAQEELKTSEEKYRILTEGAPIGIYTSDCEGNFLYGNKMAEEIFGFGREELVGKNLVNLKLLSLSDVNKITELLTLSKLGKETEPHEFTLNRNDGSKVIIRNHNRLLTISGEKLVLTMVEDITERKRSEEQIKASLKEKEVLLKEIHHRVKNNLQVICSLLYLQSTKVGDKRALEMFTESQNRVRSMALIHEKLYQSKDMANIDFSEYVQSLTTYLFHSYGVKAGTISMNLSIDNVLLGVDKAIPCGLIINELVSNSLKYAFPNGNKGEINIQLYSDNDNHVIMNIDDNGVGIPEDIDFQKTKTLGLQLVNILTRQLKGTIKLDHEEGTRFEIVFAR